MILPGKDKLISVRNLHKYYGSNHILKGVDFELNRGTVASVIGRSGCGKTTFLRCLNCLEVLDFGSMSVGGITLSRGRDILDEAELEAIAGEKINRKKQFNFFKKEALDDVDEDFKAKAQKLRTKVGMLFQALHLFPNLNVMANVAIAPEIVKGESKEQAREKAKKMLEKVGMEKYLDRMPYELSGGQQQRVAIARALAMEPELMLYDEPTSALDPELVEEVIEVMNNLNREGMTQIVVTHSMSVARKVSDLVVYMDDGNIVEMTPPDEMFSNPKDERTKEYLKILID